MLDDDFTADQIPYYVVGNASDIGGGLAKLSVMPCSIRIDDFSTNMAKARRGYHSNDEFLAIFRRRREMLRKWLKSNLRFHHRRLPAEYRPPGEGLPDGRRLLHRPVDP